MLLYISTSYPCPKYKDGATVRIFNILNSLRSYDEIMFIYIGEYDEQQEVESVRFFNSINIEYKSIRYENNFFTLKKLFGLPLISNAELKNISNLISKNNINKVFLEGLYTAPLYRLFKNVNCLFIPVDCISLASFKQFMIKKQSFNSKFLHFVKFIHRFYYEILWFNLINKICFVSKEDSNFIPLLDNKHIYVIPNGVDLDYFTPIKIDIKNKVKLVFTGVLSSSMNIDAVNILLNFMKFHNKNSLELIIAGRNPTPYIIDQCKKNNVTLISNPDDLRLVFDENTLFVCPIFFGTGIKNNVLQSLSMSIPTLVTGLVAKPIGLQNGIDTIIVDSVEDFYNVLNNIESYNLNEIGVNGYNLIKDSFSWDVIVKRYLDL